MISKEEIVPKIRQDLPTLPTIVTRIMKIVLDNKSSVGDVSKIVRLDSALTSKVLRVVNSAAYALPQKISTLTHAMAILGFDTLKKLFLSISIFDNFSHEDQVGYFFNKSHFWCHSLATANVALNIAKVIKYESPDEAYVAGLLHDIGKIIIEQIMYKKYKKYLKNLNLNPTMSTEFEEENLSINHAMVGKLALEKWNLPATLQQAIEFHHGTKGTEMMSDLAAIVSVADFICWTQALGSFNFFFHPTLNPQTEKIVNLKDLEIEDILKKMNEDLTLNAEIFNFQLTDLKVFREALQRANFELGKINSLYDNTKKKLERHIRDLNTLNNIICKTRELLEPSQIIQNVLRAIQEGFGFSRLIWFSINHRKRMIIPHTICGDFENNHPITRLGCKFDEELGLSLFKCTQKKKIVYLKEAQNGILISDVNLLKCFLTNELLLVPIKTDKKILDLLLIDNPEGSVFISDDLIKVLDILSLNVGMALENARLFQNTAQMAIIDPLTEVFNRRQLDLSLNNEINRSIRFGQSFSIAIIDIDNFKRINDTYGHQSGDVILKDVAGIIKNNSRDIDIVGRLGGDEFLAILPNTQLQGAFTFAERVRLVIEKYSLLRQNNFSKCKISVSIGIAKFDHLDTHEKLMNKADKALYQSKGEGRNLVSHFTEKK